MAICDAELTLAARAFVAAALRVLESQHVVPRPVFHPYIRVGRDYSGPHVASLPEFAAIGAAVKRAHPRFSDDTPLKHRDSAGAYIFSFLESCVARCCLAGESLSPFAEAVDESLIDLHSALERDTWEVACCREVSHLTTVDRKPLDLSGVTVVPLNDPPGDQSREAAR